MGEKFDKKTGVIISTIIFGFFMASPYNFRLLGFFPENGTSNLLLIYTLLSTIGFTFMDFNESCLFNDGRRC